jgi:hypothetical protein
VIPYLLNKGHKVLNLDLVSSRYSTVILIFIIPSLGTDSYPLHPEGQNGVIIS